MSPLVSVIIAAYREHAYLREAIDSALKQRFPSFEVIVSDDSCSPQIQRLVDSYQDNRLIYRRNESQLGVAKNHWAAFRAARGKFLAILNHDDRWEEEFLENLVPPLECDPDLVLSFSDHYILDASGKRLLEETKQSSRFCHRDTLPAGAHRPFFRLVVQGVIPVAQASVIRKSALTLDALPEEAGPAYDLWLAYLLSKTGKGAYYCAKRLSGWRRHPASISSAWDIHWTLGSALCWDAMAADRNFQDDWPVIRQRQAICYSVAAVRALRLRDLRGRDYARRSIKAAWLNARAWQAWALSFLPKPVIGWVFRLYDRNK